MNKKIVENIPKNEYYVNVKRKFLSDLLEYLNSKSITVEKFCELTNTRQEFYDALFTGKIDLTFQQIAFIIYSLKANMNITIS